MLERKTTRRGPGRPRKGLVKVTLSLLPEQLATLRIYALAHRAFSNSGPARPDLSEAVRALLSEPAVSEVLRSAYEAFMRKLDQLSPPLKATERDGVQAVQLHNEAARLAFGVLDRTYDVLGGFPLDPLPSGGDAQPSKRARRKR